MTDRVFWALDEDPNEALAVLLGDHKGSKAWAAICLADAIKRGDYPDCWSERERLTP